MRAVTPYASLVASRGITALRQFIHGSRNIAASRGETVLAASDIHCIRWTDGRKIEKQNKSWGDKGKSRANGLRHVAGSQDRRRLSAQREAAPER
jgi:hypothetical protein